MNPVKRRITFGLNFWKAKDATIDKLGGSTVKVPKITIGSGNKTIILISGFHLEETSGPMLLLDPKMVIPIIRPLLDKSIRVIIYPVINKFGLNYGSDEHENLLRKNQEGTDYNDAWGMGSRIKPEEIVLVESEILSLWNKGEILFSVSFHEDSVTPKKGYIWTNGVDLSLRKKITKKIKSKIDRNLLLDMKDRTFEGGIVEDGFVIANAKDKTSYENWMAEELNVPTVLSEAPFGLPLSVRKKFQVEVLKIVLSSFLNL